MSIAKVCTNCDMSHQSCCASCTSRAVYAPGIVCIYCANSPQCALCNAPVMPYDSPAAICYACLQKRTCVACTTSLDNPDLLKSLTNQSRSGPRLPFPPPPNN
jgi:hypothetical protein